MATTLANLPLELAHFNNFKQYIPGYSKMCEKTILKLEKLGMIEVSTAFEQAISNVGQIKVISEDCADFADGSDAKYTSVRESNLTRPVPSYSSEVSGLRNKTGTLRVQCYERKQKKFYYFKIPSEAYEHCKETKKATLEIPFEYDGTPRRIPRYETVKQNWWNYEVSSFEEMAN